MNQSAESRKKQHLELAQAAQSSVSSIDGRFNYEPLFFSHPNSETKEPITFLGARFDYPFWVSSMTGGTEFARTINTNLARLCGKHKLGMGLGSCRSLLGKNDRFGDFDVRRHLGRQPFYANLGVAQIQELIDANQLSLIDELLKRLEADGLIVHLNPLQEWFQPEGDRYTRAPIETLEQLLSNVSYPVIVKEVGHGLGPKSLAALLKLPVRAIEFGAFGGTNFTLLEGLRGEVTGPKTAFINVGHSAAEMVDILNALPKGKTEFIISGGIKTVLDGHQFRSRLQAPAVIGMAQAFLAPARESFEALDAFFLDLRESYLTATSLLSLKVD